MSNFLARKLGLMPPKERKGSAPSSAGSASPPEVPSLGRLVAGGGGGCPQLPAAALLPRSEGAAAVGLSLQQQQQQQLVASFEALMLMGTAAGVCVCVCAATPLLPRHPVLPGGSLQMQSLQSRRYMQRV